MPRPIYEIVPLPETVRLRAPIVVLVVLISTRPPALTVSELDELPRALDVLSESLPSLTVVPPVNVLAPDRLQVPAPVFTSASFPTSFVVASWIIPTIDPEPMPPRLRVVVFPAADVPCTATVVALLPNLKLLPGAVALAENVAEPPLPWMSMRDVMVS